MSSLRVSQVHTVDAAAGRHFLVVGEVEHGNAWGRVLGFPTANIPMAADGVDLEGVWAGSVTFTAEGVSQHYVSAVSVGTRPTYYADGILLLEAFLLDFTGDLYGRTLTVALHERIRGQVAYTGSEALIAQLRVDVEQVRSWAADH
ncbi:hypothetical protein B7R54_17710 [Subtercola boreus]|uniref:riboflavin kinase n=1 Tax=Subtercola boreus TaxID=120213 RepID=A0A3E0VLP2_9MICO|nr:riboflavin kinase [Subtercola boreus]RFA10836.1 hypothetical protein B7R54_17710 [Subtercola boreus]TQL55582.1 riboflavin kinase/FMN adenylyltransferase [Subtercola boreus]